MRAFRSDSNMRRLKETTNIRLRPEDFAVDGIRPNMAS